VPSTKLQAIEESTQHHVHHRHQQQHFEPSIEQIHHPFDASNNRITTTIQDSRKHVHLCQSAVEEYKIHIIEASNGYIIID